MIYYININYIVDILIWGIEILYLMLNVLLNILKIIELNVRLEIILKKFNTSLKKLNKQSYLYIT
ncbi:hypothetical protein BGI33_12535 [Snodgrassella alvi]|nr:hypothetical protein BGI33_12535 [Snodgrassella alvi]